MIEKKEWTLMFYLASDHPLAPSIVSHLKALKSAGYHPEAHVVAYFDPHPYGTPAHIFEVNRIEKLENPKPKIGFKSNDPYVRNLMRDKLWGEELSRDGITPIRKLIQELEVKPGLTSKLPALPPESTAAESGGDADPAPGASLASFLTFCADNYQAKHYMLFILGHGLIVGGDMFLYDEN